MRCELAASQGVLEADSRRADCIGRQILGVPSLVALQVEERMRDSSTLGEMINQTSVVEDAI